MASVRAGDPSPRYLPAGHLQIACQSHNEYWRQRSQAMPSNSARWRDARIGLRSLRRRRQDTTPLQQFPVSLQSPQVGESLFLLSGNALCWANMSHEISRADARRGGVGGRVRVLGQRTTRRGSSVRPRSISSRPRQRRCMVRY